MHQDRQIIFFDGVCNLCNGFVDFLLRRDSERLFAFAPLQGETARRTLNPEKISELHSVVLFNQGQALQKSDAALMILQQLGGIWNFVRVFWAFPRPLRDFVYDRIARNRYHLFGRRETCRLPTPQERERFLD